jgi:hypothetical protein
MSKDHTICPLPWIHLAQRNNGHYRVCCHTNQSLDKGIIKDENLKTLTATETPISEVRNAPTLKNLRQTMLSGQWHLNCTRCEQEENAGLKSRRINELKKWTSSFSATKARLHTKPDGSIDEELFPLESYDIRLGNVCNLKCRMCGPADSRAWYSDYQKLHKLNHFKDTQGSVFFTDQKKNDPYLWFENNFFWEELYKYRKSIRTLYLVGGEPLLIDQHFQFLNSLVKDGTSKNIELIYNSNLTKLDSSTLELWSQFREVNVGVSIDGVGDVNDYIRSGSTFTTIEKNIDILDNAGGNIHLWLSPTLQVYNVLHIPEFIRWVLNKNFNFIRQSPNSRLLFFHPLHTPKYFNIQALPKKIKAQVTSAYENLFDELLQSNSTTFNNNITSTIHSLKNALNFMNAQDQSHVLPLFFEQTEKLDALRNNSFANVCPELYGLLETFKKQSSSATHLHL